MTHNWIMNFPIELHKEETHPDDVENNVKVAMGIQEFQNYHLSNETKTRSTGGRF